MIWTNLKNKALGFNWIKIALYAVIAVALAGGGYMAGTYNEKEDCAKEHAEDLAWLSAYQKGQLDAYNEELRNRIRIAEEATRHSAELESALAEIGEGIDEEIIKRQPAASCGPSDRERGLYEEAVDRTRSP